jgi:hypothetical protein
LCDGAGKGKLMASRVGICAAAVAAVLGMSAPGLTGCAARSPIGAGSAGTTHLSAATPDQLRGGLGRCPQPVHYSDAQIKAISAALRSLPDNNPLQQAMSDYENERDNLRICLGR